MRGSRLAGPAVVLTFAAFAAALVALRPAAPAAPPAGAGGAAASPSGRTPAEEQAVATEAGDALRAATDDDATDSEVRGELRTLYGDYHPYFVRGDFDGDGRLDFAQAFVRRDGPEPLFDVAVFLGTPDGFRPAAWVDRGLSLATGDLSVDRTVLVVTEDVEQDVSRRFRWEPSVQRFVDVDGAGGSEEGEPWTEPDGRLGTTA